MIRDDQAEFIAGAVLGNDTPPQQAFTGLKHPEFRRRVSDINRQ
jgi:hypothetical protein